MPFVSFIVSFIGMGAVLQLAWRTMRGTGDANPGAAGADELGHGIAVGRLTPGEWQ